MRVVVVGLDGATWDLIKLWVDEGELLTFKKLVENGVYGNLESTLPPVTGPAWTSFVTGKNPGKHGIFDFVYLENGRLKLHTSKDNKAKPFYEFLSGKGVKNIIISLPLSYPPTSEFNGIMISDFLFPRIEIFPESKKEYIKNYRVVPDFTKTDKDLLEDMINVAKSQVEVAKKLFYKEKWDLYFFYFPETDSVSHHFWRDLTHNTEIGLRAKEIFYIANDFLSWILDKIDKNTILILISDHGFGEYPYKIYINKLLANEGYLMFTIKESEKDENLGKHLLKYWGKQGNEKIFKMPKVLYKLATYPQIWPISRYIYKLLFRNKQINLTKSIDFQKSKAFTPTSESFGIYINTENIRERSNIEDKLINLLNTLEYSNRKVFIKIFKKDDVYSGPFINLAPDILFLTNGFYVDASFSEKLFKPFKQRSFHELMGIFLAYGPGIKKGYEIKNAKIYDIAPTLLYIFGLPVPKDMDGRVLKEIFEGNSEFIKRKIVYQVVKNEKEKIRKRIKDLKFLGKS